MELGTFSISLAVKNLDASRTFYEKFGFEVVGGDPSQNWLILRNAGHTIGLFQGMFESNILTFNPGWDAEAQPLDSFTDVRDLQRQLKAKGIQLVSEADEETTGPASLRGGRPRRKYYPRRPTRLIPRSLTPPPLPSSPSESRERHCVPGPR